MITAIILLTNSDRFEAAKVLRKQLNSPKMQPKAQISLLWSYSLPSH